MRLLKSNGDNRAPLVLCEDGPFPVRLLCCEVLVERGS